MTPLALFLLGCATVFLGVVQAAFSALMRLSLRLMAERGGRDDRLGHYLDDPLQLFVPVRLLIGVCTVLAGALIARLSDIHNSLSVTTFIVSLVAFVVICEHVLPMLIVRRDPEASARRAAAGVSSGSAAAHADHSDDPRRSLAYGARCRTARQTRRCRLPRKRASRKKERSLRKRDANCCSRSSTSLRQSFAR